MVCMVCGVWLPVVLHLWGANLNGQDTIHLGSGLSLHLWGVYMTHDEEGMNRTGVCEYLNCLLSLHTCTAYSHCILSLHRLYYLKTAVP